MIAYALQGVIFLLLALIIVLMVRGGLYIREHLAPVPDSELPDGNMEPDDPALSEPPIVPIEPTIPGEVAIPDWIASSRFVIGMDGKIIQCVPFRRIGAAAELAYKDL